MKRIISVLASVFFVSLLSSAEKRLIPVELTTSVIIPCHFKHFSLLTELLIEYTHQVTLPNEVVVSLSGINDLTPEQRKHLQKLQQTRWPFSLKIIQTPHNLSAGENRNKACESAIGDIFICQDADDLPHFQRIEIIKWFFENYDIDQLQHGFIQSCDKNALDYVLSVDALHFETLPSYSIISSIANGPTCILRKVFSKVKWEFYPGLYAEDVLFNQTVYDFSFKTVTLYDPIYLYRRGIKS